MRILFLTSGREVPSSRFRVLQYVPYFEQRGHHCVVAPSRPPKYRGWPWLGNRLSEFPRAGARTLDLLRAAWSRFDVVVVERELFSSSITFFEKQFRRVAPAIVLDVDDGIFLSAPQKFQELAALCDTVVAGNRLIAAYSDKHNPRTVLIPTSLDLSRYEYQPPMQRVDQPIVLGWTGTAGNYPQLGLITEALRKLSAERGYELRIIAEREPPTELTSLDNIKVRFQPWNAEREIEDLRAFDIGLMPLPDDEWARYKCGLKVLQYLALGIPAIASPVGVNSEILTHDENGLLADSTAAWIEAIERLADDIDLRRKLATAGRATVEASYSVEKNVTLWEEVLNSAAAP
ncbi:Glycosyl transferases group 1 [Symmachiella dynata]|uniref:Glycosyl transferases group 1 n=1 Tax=Symmachiella dynata TaxID=2527995 RepID=A0A517ZNA7_9PLAN|nr:glycosyltransferase [Symmachiella dynata]QDU43957.1 Glycosyl transferases group 1 [Symmachiella dynata]